ncbi:aspartic peptidase domain-containing protein [Lasiosphaeria ovina]|uniref:Aspartic peptidase domain-containing protein n=1 Tax=Lasiosphaeria ovina TaxID=92902 RepID=A0AAE0TWC5_9PEZI|nr:aspartic peptidase domain-containing protein [Lasiosphaeria ovina]
MPALLLLAASLVASGLASAVLPRIDSANTGTASLKQVRNPHFFPHGPSALAKVYHKYGVPLSDDLRLAVAGGIPHKRVTGSGVASPQQYDVEYLTPISVGTPPLVLNLNLDTGSSDLWVFSSELPPSEINGQTVYDPTKSTSAKKLEGATWEIEYGDGSSSEGDVYIDSVAIGDLTVTAQAVQAAKNVSAEFTADTHDDGLLGLAFNTINTVQPTRQKTFYDNAQSILDAPVFTADLKDDAPGHYNFGYIDSSAYTGNISYLPVDSSQGFWMFTSPGYAISKGGYKITEMKGIADTGTTLLLLPTSVVLAYYKQVDGARYEGTQGGYIFACSATLPDFVFAVGNNARITVPGKYINYAPTDSSGTTCFGGIQKDIGIGFSIFGDVALKAAFVVFDGPNQQLGWAAKPLYNYD